RSDSFEKSLHVEFEILSELVRAGVLERGGGPMIDAAISLVVHGGLKAQRTLQLKGTLAGNVQIDLLVEADGVGDELPSLRELARQQRLERCCYDIIFDGVADGDTRNGHVLLARIGVHRSFARDGRAQILNGTWT